MFAVTSEPLTGGGSLTLASPAEVRVFWQIFVHGSYALPPRCRTILDCGANVGIFSIWAARRHPHARIVALEPFPATFAALEANIRRPLHFVFRSDHNQTVQALVASGVGCALVPKLTMDPEDETTKLIDLAKLPPRLIALAWHRDRYRTPAAHAFVETAQEVTAELELEPVAA